MVVKALEVARTWTRPRKSGKRFKMFSASSDMANAVCDALDAGLSGRAFDCCDVSASCRSIAMLLSAVVRCCKGDG